MPDATLSIAEQTPRDSTGITPLLVAADEAARLCGISRSSWDRLTSAGRTPAPLRLSGSVRWRLSDLEAWVELGCPLRREFEALKEQAAGRERRRR